MSVPIFKTGSYSGTTAAQTITVGFRPSLIHAVNLTESNHHWMWADSFTPAFVGTVSANAGIGQVSITVTDHGFSLPASNSVVNGNGVSYAYFCARGN